MMVDDTAWHVLLSQHVNVMILGEDADVESTLADVTACSYVPRFTWPDVPPLTPDVACTVIVRGVSELSVDEWQSLQDLMDQAVCPVQIVSTARSTLFEAVERGAFPAPLYYRLNVMLLGRPQSGPCPEMTPSERTPHGAQP